MKKLGILSKKGVLHLIITNKHNLPQAFVSFATQEYEYATGEYRVTSLIKGLKETILLRRHSNEITVDVSDMVWLLLGTAVHHILEQEKESDTEIKEERIKLPIGDYIVSGQPDLYCDIDKLLTDYKTTSVWKIIKANYEDWKLQLIIYAILLESLGFIVNKARIVAFLKDHSRTELLRNPDYPPLPVHTVWFDITANNKINARRFLESQFQLISEYEQLEDDNIPVCSPKDRWVSDWAVMKEGNKRASRVLATEEEAWKWVDENIKLDDLNIINVISRGDLKCQHYCYVNKFCNYYRETYNG